MSEIGWKRLRSGDRFVSLLRQLDVEVEGAESIGRYYRLDRSGRLSAYMQAFILGDQSQAYLVRLMELGGNVAPEVSPEDIESVAEFLGFEGYRVERDSGGVWVYER